MPRATPSPIPIRGTFAVATEPIRVARAYTVGREIRVWCGPILTGNEWRPNPKFLSKGRDRAGAMCWIAPSVETMKFDAELNGAAA